MKSIAKVFAEVLEASHHKCEQCGALEAEGRPLRPYFIDGCRSIVTRENVVAFCPGCLSHVASTWPPGSNWRFGSPAWAINRGHFRKHKAPIAAGPPPIPLEDIPRGERGAQDPPGQGERVGGVIKKILDDAARKRSHVGKFKKSSRRCPTRPER